MTTRYKTHAIVFRKNNVNEADRNFSVFTDDFGQLDIFAKAIRKITSKLRGGIDIFYLSEIEFIQGKARKTLTDATTLEKFKNISQDAGRLKAAMDITEVLDNFIKGQEKDDRLFGLLKKSFQWLDDENLKSEKCKLVYYYFLWNIFSLLGYHSEVNICASCGNNLKPQQLYFSGKDGGVICGSCFKEEANSLDCAQKINSDTVKILRIILSQDQKTLFKLKIDPDTEKLLLEVSDNAVQAFCPN
jgi:DNA repair protein RecO (recombination protein O)